MNSIVEKLYNKENLSFEETKNLFTQIMEGKFQDEKIISLLESFILKGRVM